MLRKGITKYVPIDEIVETVNPPIFPPKTFIIAKVVMNNKGAAIKIAV